MASLMAEKTTETFVNDYSIPNTSADRILVSLISIRVGKHHPNQQLTIKITTEALYSHVFSNYDLDGLNG